MIQKFCVVILGAGSVGNHLAYACRQKGWKVVLFDRDKAALTRTRDEIYPTRYGQWDQEIELTDNFSTACGFEPQIVFIGTPPASHIEMALQVLRHIDPRILMIEKPLCTPSMEGVAELLELSEKKSVRLLVGYNHLLTKITKFAEELISADVVGVPLSIHVRWQEYWGGILAAHPWLSGPEDSYLGRDEMGGGALSEHSHGISLWLHFACFLGKGKVTRIDSTLDKVKCGQLSYDRTAVVALKTEDGLHGSVIQDVVTEPPTKAMRIQGTHGFLEWHANYEPGCDCVVYGTPQKINMERIPKTRIDDFRPEIEHVESLLNDSSIASPIDLSHGVDVMNVISAAHSTKYS